MNKKATVFTVIFQAFIFFVLFALALGAWLASTGQDYVDINEATGVEAFFYENITVFVVIIVFIAILAYATWGSG